MQDSQRMVMPDIPKEALKIDSYYGDRDKTEKWLSQVQVYMVAKQIPVGMQAIIAAQYMKGRAEDWVLPKRMAFLEGKEEESLISFGNFKRTVMIHFGETNSEPQAERKIQVLKQTTSVADYASAFTRYSDRTDWDNTALMVMFRRGLKDQVKDELVRSNRKEPLNLEDLIKHSIAIDDKWYERSMEKRHTQGRPFQSRDNRDRYSARDNRRTNYQEDTRQTTRMELDNATKGDGKKRFGNRKFQKKTFNNPDIICYNCDKKGHIARNCRSPKKATGQFNMVMKEPTSPEGSDEYHSEDYQWEDDQETREAGNDYPYWHDSDGHAHEKEIESDEYDAAKALVRLSVCERTLPTSQAWRTITIDTDTTSTSYGKILGTPTIGRKGTPYPTMHEDQEKETKHAYLSWTACYDDHCYTHMSEKEGSGWYPRKPSKRQKRPAYTREEREATFQGSTPVNTDDSDDDTLSQEAKIAALRIARNEKKHYGGRSISESHDSLVKTDTDNDSWEEISNPETKFERKANEQLSAMTEELTPFLPLALRTKSDGKDRQTKN